MVYARDLDTPPRYQSEPSSLYSQSENCGVTSSAAIADFYLDRRHNIEEGRRLIAGWGPYNVNGALYYGCPPHTPTNAYQQRDMLIARGIPADVVKIWNTTQLHAIVDSGRRPMILGLNFAYVNDSVAGHSFQGWHAIKVRDGNPGYFVVNDPNFWPGSTDATRGRRVYGDNVVQYALNVTGGTTAVVPRFAKVVGVPDTSADAPVYNFEEAEMAVMQNVVRNSVQRKTLKGGSGIYLLPNRKFKRHTIPSGSTEDWEVIGGIVGEVVGGNKQWWQIRRPVPSAKGEFFCHDFAIIN